MKKIIFIGGLTLCLTSCKRNWICECTTSRNPTTSGWDNGYKSYVKSIQYPLIEQSKSSSKTTCDAWDFNVSQYDTINPFFSTINSCVIK